MRCSRSDLRGLAPDNTSLSEVPIRTPYSEEPSLHSERLYLIQKAKPIDLLLLTLLHFGNVLFRGTVISVNWPLRTQLYYYSNTVYSLCLLVKLQKCIYTALVSYPLASSSNSTTVLPQLYVLIISFGEDPYITKLGYKELI